MGRCFIIWPIMDLKMPKIDLNNAEVAFVDIETGSFKPDADILEIGGVLTNKNLEIVESFDLLIKPRYLSKADPLTLELIGYNEEKWANAYQLKEALNILYPKFKNKILAGWISHFDYARLERAFYENGFDHPFDYRKIDVFSLAVARYGLKNLTNKETLTKICQILNIDRGKSHRAYDDAYASYKVFLKLMCGDENKSNEEIIVYTDGGTIQNPGRAAIGILIKTKDKTKEYFKEVGIKTNNQAEYEAIIFALEKIKHFYGKSKIKQAKIILHTDSELVGKQIKNEYKVLEGELIPYFIKFHNLKLDFGEIEIKIISREENKIADKLVKKALFPKFSTVI